MLLLLACADPTYPVCEVDDTLPTLDHTPTWERDVRPIVEARCQSCHTAGGISPMAFDSYADTWPWAESIAFSVADRSMPPWPPADCCRPLQHALDLEPEEIATLVDWAAADTPEGDAADYVAPEIESAALPRVDLSLAMDEAYTPEAGGDDTRCFLIDWPEDGFSYVTGLGIRPGAPEEVHHALLLIADSVTVPEFEALDELDDGPGWSCPGGVVLGYTGWIGGWSPGWSARELPEGTGQRVDPGSKLILTVHYSTPDGVAEPDQTTIDLMVDDSVDHELAALSVYDPAWLATLDIPAGEPDVVETYASAFGIPWKLLGVNLHMHERGSSGSIGIEHADGSTDCLLQIDDWDHDWQGDYLFAEPVDLAWDDRVWVECHWDNTDGNQRVVGGVAEEPRDLAWAEDQEMCVGFLTAQGI